MWLITEGSHQGILCLTENEALKYVSAEELQIGGYFWISLKPIPKIGGHQNIEEIPQKWRLFVEGFRACEQYQDATNEQN